MNPKSVDAIQRIQTNNQVVPKDFLKITQENLLYHEIMYSTYVYIYTYTYK